MTVKCLRVLLLAFVLTAVRAWAAPVEDWASAAPANTGTFADDKGSKISFEVVEGAKTGEKAFRVEANPVQDGYCGVWHNVDVNLSKAVTIKLMAKADPPSTWTLTITDANKAQYVAKISVASKDWAEVAVPITAFELNKYYQPEGVDTNKPLDLSKVSSLGFAPEGKGAVKVWFGTIASVEEDVKAKEKAKVEAKKSAPKGNVVLQDFETAEDGLGGVWKDEKGTTIDLTYKAAPKKDKPADRTANLKFNLTAGGWCGMWYRAGSNWDGVDCAGAKSMVVKCFSEKPMEFGISLEDVNKLKFDGVTPTATTGGRWEAVTIPMDSLPEGFSIVKTFNVYMKTPGENLLAIDTITVVR